MALRITAHKGKTTSTGTAYSARHLDRHFDLKKAKHIDPARTHLNRYVEFHVDADGTLHHNKSANIQKHEIAVYKRLFERRLNAVNERYIAQRHHEKCKTLMQYYRSPQSCPDEYLLYIGNQDYHASSDVLTAAASKLIAMLQAKYPNNFIPLDVALHRDERGIGDDGEGAHIHFRCCWICSDKDGSKVSITKGMKEAGIQLPDEGSSAQRYNNRQMTFSEEIRKTFADICEQDFGLEIEREARDASQSGKTLATYQRDQARQELQKADELISRVRAETSLEALKKERISEEIAILEEKKSSLETALGRLKALFLPIKKFLKRLSGIQISSSRTALDELLLDSECVPAYDVLRELEGPNPI